MKNILRSDFYRFRHQPGVYVVLVVAFLMMCMNACSLGLVLGNASWLSKVYQNMFDTVGSSAELSELFATFSLLTGMSSESVFEFISLNMKADLLYYMAVFVAIFIAAPKNTGYLKNTASYYDRNLFFCSKLVLLFLYSFLILVVTFCANALASLIFFEDLPLGDITDFAVYVGLTLLLLFTVGVIMSIFAGLFRRPTTGIILIFVYLTLGSGLVYAVMDMILGTLIGREVTIELFTPVGAMSVLKYGNGKTSLIAAIVVGIYLFMSILYEMTLARRKDLI